MLIIIVAVVLFVLAWWFVSVVPLPATMPAQTRNIGYALVILAAFVWVWHTYLR